MKKRSSVARVTVALVVMVAAAGCAHSGNSTPITTPASQPPQGSAVTHFQRADSYRDEERAAAGVGSIAIAPRSVDRPTESLQGATAELSDSAGKIVKVGSAGEQPTLRLENIPVGRYRLKVTRLGYHQIEIFPVVVDPGCRTEVESYLTIAMTGIEPLVVSVDKDSRRTYSTGSQDPQPTRWRAAITRCGWRPGR